MADNGTVIQARGLTRRFGKITAVDGIDLDIQRGEVFGFLGPNGAGKSTLIRMLVGLATPSAGTAEVLGFTLPGSGDSLRPLIGYMTQKFSLYDDLTVQENLEFAGEVFGLERELRRQRVEELLEEYRMVDRREQRPATLSGGWRQRLALAVATIHRPRLLVLDEPTAGVDPDNRRSFWDKIFELSADGTTVLVSTHYMDEAVRCHRLCMMIDGRKAAVGRPRSLIKALSDRVVEIWARPSEAAIPKLRDMVGVASVTQLGSAIHLLLERGGSAERMAPELRRQLLDAGFESAEAESSDPSLEDVFVALLLGEDLKVDSGVEA